MRKFILLLVCGLAITLLTGGVYGRLSQRWGPAPDLISAAGHLKTLPKEIGDWQLLSDDKMSDRIIETLSCAGYVNRQYVNRRTGATVYIAITVGPSGPISVHTPEICYSSRAYSIESEREEVRMTDRGGSEHSFWSLSFLPNTTTADTLRVYYAWNDGTTWIAATSPRLQFAGQPSLHKLQLSSLTPSGATGDSADPCKSFLKDLLQSNWSPRK